MTEPRTERSKKLGGKEIVPGWKKKEEGMPATANEKDKGGSSAQKK